MITINIKDILDKKHINKNQFAKMTQIGYPAACDLYKGSTTSIHFDTLEKICIALECTPNDILVSDNPTMNRLLSYSTLNITLKDDVK